MSMSLGKSVLPPDLMCPACGTKLISPSVGDLKEIRV